MKMLVHEGLGKVLLCLKILIQIQTFANTCVKVIITRTNRIIETLDIIIAEKAKKA